MEMKLDSNLVKSERQKRAWSQAHLAEVTGLGLRTIQRIEKTGSASYESVRALASVFSLEIEELSKLPAYSQPLRSTRDRISRSISSLSAGIATVLLVATTAIFVNSTSWAEQIMIDVGISQNDEKMIMGQLLTAEGKEAEIRINDAVRVVIDPTIQEDGEIFLSVRIYEMLDGKFVLLSKPKLITANHKEAEIRIKAGSGNLFRVLITPHASD